MDPSKQCNLCKQKFGLTRRTHKCKRCKRTVCSSCAKGKRVIVGYEDTTPHRTCDVCEVDVQFQQKLIRVENITWNSISSVGKDWMQTIRTLAYICLAALFETHFNREMQKEGSYKQYLEEANKVSDSEGNFDDIDKDVGSGRTSRSCFNYSLHEFLHYVQGNTPEKSCRESITNVLLAHCMRNPTMGYVQGMNYISLYLLCFLNEESAFWMLTHLIENVLPPHFYSKVEKGFTLSGYHAEAHALKKVAPGLANLVKKEQIGAMEAFLDMLLPTALIPLMVDMLGAPCVYYLWNSMIRSQSFIPIEKAVVCIVEKYKGLIFQDDTLTVRNYREIFARDMTSDYLETQVSMLELSSKNMAALRNEYGAVVDQQPERKPTRRRKTLVETKKFSKPEVEMLQREYFALVSARSGKHGISRNDFISLVSKINSKDVGGLVAETDPVELFDLFDVNRDGTLDFKEFLSCASLLMRGELEDKVIFCFKHHDRNEKNYLTPEEFANFLDTICRACMIIATNEVEPLLLTKMSSFKTAMLKISKEKSKIKYADVQEAMMKNELMQVVNEELGGKRRRSSAIFLASRMASLIKKPEVLEEKKEENPDDTSSISSGTQHEIEEKIIILDNSANILEQDSETDIQSMRGKYQSMETKKSLPASAQSPIIKGTLALQESNFRKSGLEVVLPEVTEAPVSQFKALQRLEKKMSSPVSNQPASALIECSHQPIASAASTSLELHPEINEKASDSSEFFRSLESKTSLPISNHTASSLVECSHQPITSGATTSANLHLEADETASTSIGFFRDFEGKISVPVPNQLASILTECSCQPIASATSTSVSLHPETDEEASTSCEFFRGFENRLSRRLTAHIPSTFVELSITTLRSVKLVSKALEPEEPDKLSNMVPKLCELGQKTSLPYHNQGTAKHILPKDVTLRSEKEASQPLTPEKEVYLNFRETANDLEKRTSLSYKSQNTVLSSSIHALNLRAKKDACQPMSSEDLQSIESNRDQLIALEQSASKSLTPHLRDTKHYAEELTLIPNTPHTETLDKENQDLLSRFNSEDLTSLEVKRSTKLKPQSPDSVSILVQPPILSAEYTCMPMSCEDADLSCASITALSKVLDRTSMCLAPHSADSTRSEDRLTIEYKTKSTEALGSEIEEDALEYEYKSLVGIESNYSLSSSPHEQGSKISVTHPPITAETSAHTALNQEQDEYSKSSGWRYECKTSTGLSPHSSVMSTESTMAPVQANSAASLSKEETEVQSSNQLLYETIENKTSLSMQPQAADKGPRNLEIGINPSRIQIQNIRESTDEAFSQFKYYKRIESCLNISLNPHIHSSVNLSSTLQLNNSSQALQGEIQDGSHNKDVKLKLLTAASKISLASLAHSGSTGIKTSKQLEASNLQPLNKEQIFEEQIFDQKLTYLAAIALKSSTTLDAHALAPTTKPTITLPAMILSNYSSPQSIEHEGSPLHQVLRIAYKALESKRNKAVLVQEPEIASQYKDLESVVYRNSHTAMTREPSSDLDVTRDLTSIYLTIEKHTNRSINPHSHSLSMNNVEIPEFTAPNYSTSTIQEIDNDRSLKELSAVYHDIEDKNSNKLLPHPASEENTLVSSIAGDSTIDYTQMQTENQSSNAKGLDEDTILYGQYTRQQSNLSSFLKSDNNGSRTNTFYADDSRALSSILSKKSRNGSEIYDNLSIIDDNSEAASSLQIKSASNQEAVDESQHRNTEEYNEVLQDSIIALDTPLVSDMHTGGNYSKVEELREHNAQAGASKGDSCQSCTLI